MTTANACKPLADHFAERQADGLVDIKFYVHNTTGVSVEKACAEAQTLFAARDSAETFVFGDRRTA
jgi:hypothetical protein